MYSLVVYGHNLWAALSCISSNIEIIDNSSLNINKILNYISARFNDIDSFGPFEFSEYIELLSIVEDTCPNSYYFFNEFFLLHL